MLKFKYTGWYEPLKKGFNIRLEPGYTALIGPNGAGKTSILSSLENYCKEQNIHVMRYSNLTEGGSTAVSKQMLAGNCQMSATMLCSSEGECITLAIGDFVASIGVQVHKMAGGDKPLVILLDALDSGSSIDRIRDLRDLFELILDDSKKSDLEVYIIQACNAFEMVKNADCIDVRTGKHRKFSTYDAFARFICKNREAMDNE